MTASPLQWGGRFSQPPDPVLLGFGSSLEEDLVLAKFDVRVSLAHVEAMRQGNIVTSAQAQTLTSALEGVGKEIADGTLVSFARSKGAEDIHGAIDARVREIAGDEGEWLHAGRSRNDQVATTLLLYCAERATHGRRLSAQIGRTLASLAREHFCAGTLVAGTTHWQPAQPILLAFWLCAAAEPFVRDARRFAESSSESLRSCPLGSGALAGSSLPLNRGSASAALGFQAPSRNAMDAVGNRDAALDVAHAFVRSVLNASRICEELVIWCTPAFGYVRLDDAASTGSSLMPQKRNPDPFELVRATSACLVGQYAGALSTLSGVALSYHRDLQVTKSAVIAIVERSVAALEAFGLALSHVCFDGSRMTALAGEHYAVATDVADAMIAGGRSARASHAHVGEQIRLSEQTGQAPPSWLDAGASVAGKVTQGSTGPNAVAQALFDLDADLADLGR